MQSEKQRIRNSRDFLSKHLCFLLEKGLFIKRLLLTVGPPKNSSQRSTQSRQNVFQDSLISRASDCGKYDSQCMPDAGTLRRLGRRWAPAARTGSTPTPH